jgi:hemolysin activation/secretion protein
MRLGLYPFASTALLSVAICVDASAQTATPITQGLAPTREEIRRESVNPLPSTVPQRVTVEGEVERAPCPLAAPAYADIRLQLSRAEFSGAQGQVADVLNRIAQPWMGKDIPIAAVCEIRDTAATELRRRGYLAAVQVPPQKIDGGVVRFDVLFAKLVGFQVRGNIGRSEKIIARYLDAIRDQPVFNIVEAERYLLLAKDIPGYDVRLTLRPAGTKTGEVIGEVLVAYTPVEADLSIQNFGSRASGRFGGLAQVRLNGLLGEGDRTSISFYNTADFKEQHVARISHELKLGREGLKFFADYAHSWSRPDLGPTLDLRSKTDQISFGLSYPLIRKQAKTVGLSSGLELINQRVTLATVPVSKDKLSVAFLRADFSQTDAGSISSIAGYSASEPRWRIGSSLEARHGLRAFGASKGCGPAQVRCTGAGVFPSNVEADTTAFVLKAGLSGEFRPVPKLALVGNLRAQYAPHPLLSYEEFSAGNYTIGRGFDPGALLGETGIGVSGEVRYGKLVPKSATSIALQGYTFADAAWVHNEDRLVAPIGKQHVYAVGGGLRAAYGNRFVIDAGGAVPLNRIGAQTKRRDVRFLINLYVRLAPWGGQ